MNILYVDSTQGTGGATKSLLDMLKYLDRSRFTPVLLCHREGTFSQSFVNEGVIVLDQRVKLMQVMMFDPFLGIRCKNASFRKLIKFFGMGLKYILLFGTLLRDYILISYLIITKHIQLVHFNAYSDYYLPLAAAISRFSKVQIVFHIRGRVLPGRRVQFLTKYVTGFIYVSRFVQSYFLSKGAISKNNFCIYDGRDPREFEKARQKAWFNIRETLNIPLDHKIVVCIGTLTRGKGQDTFLKAAQIVAKKVYDVTFLIIGDNVPYEDDIKSELLRLRDQLGLTDRVLLLGQRNDVPEILIQSDISIVSTELPEALCSVNIEAMAAGVPVISTNIGAIPEVVVSGETGLLVTPGNPQAMADAILKLFKDEKLALRLAKEGHERFLRLFTAQKTATEVTRVYERLVKEAR